MKDRGPAALSKDEAKAARTAGASPATEFLGESRIALRRVLAEENGVLSQIERADPEDVLSQLDAVLDRR